MSKLFYTLLLAAGLGGLLTGCSSHYDVLEPIPEYPECTAKFDQSATIDFKPGDDARLNQAILNKFTECQYTDVISGEHYKAGLKKQIRIVAPLDLKQTILRCKDGYYLETRILVMVRLPGYITDGDLSYPAPRYFQAFSQIMIQEQAAQAAVAVDAINQAVNNLFTIAEFRSALAAGN